MNNKKCTWGPNNNRRFGPISYVMRPTSPPRSLCGSFPPFPQPLIVLCMSTSSLPSLLQSSSSLWLAIPSPLLPISTPQAVAHSHGWGFCVMVVLSSSCHPCCIAIVLVVHVAHNITGFSVVVLVLVVAGPGGGRSQWCVGVGDGRARCWVIHRH